MDNTSHQLSVTPPPAAACTCSEVTLEEFMDCLFNNNLHRLVRSGSPTWNQLSEAWGKLYDEFNSLMESGRTSNLFRLSKKVSLLEAKLQLAEVVMLVGGELAEKTLRELGYSGGTAGVEAKLLRDSVALEEARRELAAEQREADGRKGAGMKEGFTRWINAVGKYMEFHINRKVISVAEFVDMHQMMQQELREAQKMATKNGR